MTDGNINFYCSLYACSYSFAPYLPHCMQVALADILLVRVLPPLAFAVVGYPLMGLNSEPDNPACLLWFAGILVRAWRASALCVTTD